MMQKEKQPSPSIIKCRVVVSCDLSQNRIFGGAYDLLWNEEEKGQTRRTAKLSLVGGLEWPTKNTCMGFNGMCDSSKIWVLGMFSETFLTAKRHSRGNCKKRRVIPCSLGWSTMWPKIMPVRKVLMPEKCYEKSRWRKKKKFRQKQYVFRNSEDIIKTTA